MHRRDFLARAAAYTAGLYGLRARGLGRGGLVGGYGPLFPDPQGLLDLPAGFSYALLSLVGDTMSDGFKVPDRCDGMAAFAGPPGQVILVRNHELVETDSDGGPFGGNNALYGQLNPSLVYDNGFGDPSLGGTTTILYDMATGAVLDQHLSLAGTLRNCSGGTTPWGTWITCEETTQVAGPAHEQDHGFCFEVTPTANGQLTAPNRLPDLGRFNHEAIGIDPGTGHVYLTEDRDDSVLYRFIPDVPGQLSAGGQLQAAVVLGWPTLDTSNHNPSFQVPVGGWGKVRWVNLEDPFSSRDDLRYQAAAQGAAKFARGEGMAVGSDGVYFATTDGGFAHKGQVWRYRPYPAVPVGTSTPEGSIELWVEADNTGPFNRGDNLTVAPNGDLYVCEDGGTGNQLIVGITPSGFSFPMVRNVADQSEFAGATFSPDGSILFVNLYRPGRTFAITGPF